MTSNPEVAESKAYTLPHTPRLETEAGGLAAGVGGSLAAALLPTCPPAPSALSPLGDTVQLPGHCFILPSTAPVPTP